MTTLSVIGNPANRRVTMFVRAALDAGLPPPRVYAWRDVLRGGPLPGPGEVVRIDSAGEDAEVDRLLRGAPAEAEHGEIIGGAAAYAGLAAALHRVEAAGATLLNAPDDILTMSDKRRCHALLSARGVPVPPALPAVTGYDSLRAAMRSAGWGRVFVKPAHGSSASGVLALTAAPGRVEAVTSVERAPGGRLFNNLTIRRYDREADVAAIVDALAGDGLHVERWFPKAGVDGRTIDLRVVVIAGEPRHVVVRASRSPLTNLHLGNARGDVARVRGLAGTRAWDAAMETCARVGAAFPRTLMAGVDLMFGSRWERYAVAEVNAFGDLLPGVLDRGEDTYTAQIRAALCAV
ncbi:STM4014 family protein [Catenuloplanes sp. NPDC051500]|uniref:STM4014 family protein n=1 Tax=Catenuloplanes sp. NPDC051500 TaxID=3363959 RepID=UPI0037B8F3F8